MNKKEFHKFKGMNRDLAPMSVSSDLAYDIRNMRITVNKTDNSLMVWTNERGPIPATYNLLNTQRQVEIDGTYLGHAVLNNYLIIFSTRTNTAGVKHDNIKVVEFNTDGTINGYYSLVAAKYQNGQDLGSDLGFDENYPIETLPLYENDKLQKVYFVDGKNSPRVVNIVDSNGKIRTNFYTIDNKTLLDFSVNVSQKHTLDIEKTNTGGTFPTGMIQYAFSYFNYGMQESHLFEISPLYYLSRKERGDLTTELQSCSFSIKLTNLDSNFGYVRCYAIVRTSKNATPVCRIVGDYSINNNTVSIYDTGAEGSTIDATKLFFVGGQDFVAGTLTQKDNTLFLGNIQKKRHKLNIGWQDNHTDQVLIDYDGNKAFDWSWSSGGYTFKKNGNNPLNSPSKLGTFYDYNPDNNRSSRAVKRFKSSEFYKYGIVGQYEDGSFTEVCPVGIEKVAFQPRFMYNKTVFDSATEFKHDDLFLQTNTTTFDQMDSCVLTGSFRVLVYGSKIEELRKDGIVKLYPVVVYPTEEYRSVVTQGFISPTVYKVSERYDNAPFVEASWIYRFFTNDKDDIFVPNAYHHGSLYPSVNKHSELSSTLWGFGVGKYDRILSPFAMIKTDKESEKDEEIKVGDKTYYYKKTTPAQYKTAFGQEYFQDCHTLTLNSPESELGLLDNTNLNDLSFRVVGFSSFIKPNIDISAYGGGHFSDSLEYDQALDSILSNSWIYTELDVVKNEGMVTSIKAAVKNAKKNAFPCFSFTENTGASTSGFAYHYFMDSAVGWGYGYSPGSLVMNRSVKSNLRCGFTYYNQDVTNHAIKTTPPQLFNSTVIQPLKIKYDNDFSSVLYYGNYDSIKSRVQVTDDKYAVFRMAWQSSGSVGTWEQLKAIKTLDNGTDAKTHVKDENGNIGVTATVFYRDGLNTVDDNNVFDTQPNYRGEKDENKFVNNPLNIKYRSTPHVVFSLDTDQTESAITQYVLCSNDAKFESNKAFQYPFWYKKNNTTGLSEKVQYTSKVANDIGYSSVPITKNNDAWYAGLFIGELFKTEEQLGIKYNASGWRDASLSTYMGGKEQEPYLNWVICGDAVDITNEFPNPVNYYDGDWKTDIQYVMNNGVPISILSTDPPSYVSDKANYKGSYELVYKEGDIYVGRYDSLKTYPYDESIGNGIIEIYSSELESRINLDERVDRNRGLIDNTTVRPYSNFNIFNDTAYNQDNNYFSYNAYNDNAPTVENFPNQVTWSLEKTMGEDVDTWTQIPLTSLLDLDGDKGALNYLTTFHNNIYSFQDKGIANIIFNARIQIPTGDNNPIEITNGYKVDGKRYIADNIGCQNKWSIVTGDNGIYFIDNLRSMAYLFNGESVPQSISGSMSMQSWFNDKNSKYVWTPSFAKYAIKCSYDNVRKEVYYAKDDLALVFNENVGVFTSFYDYPRMCMFENINTVPVIIEDGMLLRMFEGEYNAFYNPTDKKSNTIKPYWIEFYTNGDALPTDKNFNNIEWFTDAAHAGIVGSNIPNYTFDKVDITTPLGSASLTFDTDFFLRITGKNKLTDATKKFNRYKIPFPRLISNWNHREVRHNYQYAKVRLTKTVDSLDTRYKQTLHDISIDYSL